MPPEYRRVVSLLILGLITWPSAVPASYDVCENDHVDCPTGYRLQSTPSYVILAPTRVRAGQEITVRALVTRLDYSQLTIRTSVLRNGEELTFARETFHAPSRRFIKMKLPYESEPGNYSLKIEGLSSDVTSGLLFQNVTDLEFQAKRVSVFIFTDQQFYQKRATIKIRVVVLKPNLLPVIRGTMNVYVSDSKGHVVRRQLAVSLHNGFYSFSCPTSHPAKHGWWTIMVEGWGHKYTSHFKTESYFYHLHEVNLTTPVYVKESDYGVGCVIEAHHFSLMPSKGNATVKFEIIPPGKKNGKFITKEIAMLVGVEGFTLPMSEIRQLTHKLAGTVVKVVAKLDTWYHIETNTGKSVTRIIGDSYKISFIGGAVRVFKPNVPFVLYIAIYSENGRKFARDNNVVVKVQVTIISTTGSTKTRPEAKYDATGSVYQKMKATRHYTDRGEFLALTTSTLTPRVGTYAVFTVTCTTYVPEVHYQIIVNGQLISGDVLTMHSNQKTFSLAMSRELSPNARMLVYAILNTGEMITDSLSFHVNGIRKDDLKININRGKDFSADTIEVNAAGDPSTLTVFKTEDYELYRRKSKKLILFFNEQMLQDELESYDDHTFTRFKHTWYEDGQRKRNVQFASPSYAIDANTTFQYAGLTVITDATIPLIRTAEIDCNVTLGKLPCFTSGCYLSEQRCDGVYDCEDWADEIECGWESDVEEIDVLEDYYRIYIHLDKKDWGWKTYYTKPYGRVDFKLNLPIRDGTWVLGGFSLSPTNGLAFNEEPVRLLAGRPFKIVVMTPKAAVRGEQIGVQVAAFNFSPHPLEVLLTLKSSKKYAFVLVDREKVQSAYSPDTVQGQDIQKMITLMPGESKMVIFPVLPLINEGKLKVTILAESNINKMETTKTIKMKYDGVRNRFHTPFLLDMTRSGSLYINDINIPVNARFKNRPDQRIHDFVIGSPKALLYITGDIVGPGLSLTNHVTLWNSADYIWGSGENAIFHFGINFFLLKYLRDTDQLTAAKRKASIRALNVDMVEVYTYIMKDGGFSMRGKRSSTSVWLTGLTLEMLSMGSRAEWEADVYVDPMVLSRMSNWLCDQQNDTTGGFRRQSQFFDLKMLSNVTMDDGAPLYAPENAYVIIGLSEAIKVLKGDALTKASQARLLAADYLAKHFDLLYDPFEIAIVAYALTLSKHAIKNRVLLKLMSIARHEGELTYWSPERIEKNLVTTLNTVKYLQPRLVPTEFDAKAIQATAYAMLVYLQHNMFGESKSIMLWLQTMRNRANGFDATQDTLRATQALVAYTERDTDRSFYDMQITVSSVADREWKSVLDFKSNNIGKTYALQLPKVYNTIQMRGQGIGMVLFQLTTIVNVEHKRLLRTPAKRSFDLWVENKNFFGRNSSLMEMKVCTRWLRTDLSPRSGAAVIEVDLPSGWYVRKETLNKYARISGDIPAMRAHLNKAKVVWYLEYVDNGNNNCYYFRGERWHPVANATIQHEMRIYDNFERSHINTTFYITEALFHNHICLVCGSFQCPYCPDYSGASPSIPSPIVYVYVLCLLITVAQLFGCSNYRP